MQRARLFKIDKWKIYEAYKKVKVNGGSSGIDGIEIEAYELNLKDNLHKFWNRMSYGSYIKKIRQGE